MGKNRNVPNGLTVTTGSVEETQALGEQLGRALRAGDVVALRGELGSGKTTFIQGIARGLGRKPETIKSPTFVLLREYPGDVPLIHIDGYRLEGAASVSWLDLDLIFSPRKITVIEWAERFAQLLPEDRLDVQLSHVRTNQRRLRFGSTGPRGAALVSHLQAERPSPDRTHDPASH
jgi:tRNA threonylcarbamoyladenosine biosynthesis protein TsaE